jgi:hypothetical protein
MQLLIAGSSGMSIYINEIIKVFSRKSVLGIFLALTLLNGALLCINENQKTTEYSPSQYKAAFSDLEGISSANVANELSLRLQMIYAIESFSLGEDIDDILEEYPEIDAQTLLEDYENKSYLIYTDNIYSEEALLKDILAEAESCAYYQEYLEEIDIAAKKMTTISLFADPDSFSYKNIAKTPKAYSKLKGVELEIAPSKGISMATGFLATDLIAFLMVMTVGISIITREKELNQIVLSRTTFNGRTALGIVKLSAVCTAAFVAEILLYATNFTISYFTYGFGNLSRMLQSVYYFNGSNLKISVLQYIIFFLLAKLIVYFIFAGLICFVTVISDSASKVYGILIIIIGIETALYYMISSTSYLSPLKYINILAYANTDDLFSSYLNLNLFNNPVNYIGVFIISVLGLFIVLSLLSVFTFSKGKVIKNRTKRFNFTNISLFKGRHTSLFLHECYKIFINGKVLLILIAFTAIIFYTYEPLKENFTSVDEIYYKQYMLKLEGTYTAEKQQEIEAEDDKFQSIQAEIARAMADTKENGNLVLMKYQNTLAAQAAFEQVKEHSEYLQSTQDGEFVYDSGYKLLTGDDSAGNKDLLLALTAVIMLILCITYVYSAEYQTGASTLLKISYKGRYATFLCKFFISLIIVTVIYILTYVTYFYNVLSSYGTRKINAPLCSLEAFSDWNMTIKSYLILISIIRYLALICAMLIIFFLSTKLKSLVATLLVSTIILVLPILLSLLGITAFDYVLLNPFLISHFA